MPEEITLTTGQAIGLTGLSMQTIQRYVRRYPMGFSDRARQAARGRRFNGDDIKHLLLINRMLNAKQKDQIEKALSGELQSPDLALFEIMDFMHMVTTLSGMQKQLGELLEKIEIENRNQEFWSAKIRKAIDNHAEHINTLKSEVKWLKQARKMKNEPVEYPEIQEKKRSPRRSLADRFYDFLDQ